MRLWSKCINMLNFIAKNRKNKNCLTPVLPTTLLLFRFHTIFHLRLILLITRVRAWKYACQLIACIFLHRKGKYMHAFYA